MVPSEVTEAKTPSVLRGVRRTAIIVIVVSLSITAIIGVVTLLAGDFGELQGKVLLSTFTLAAFSITALCHLAVVGRTVQAIGFAGIAASAGAFVAALVLIWSNWGFEGDFETWIKVLGVFTVLALSLAHANLLLLLGNRRRRPIRIGLLVTLVMIVGVAVMAIIPIVTGGDVPGPNADPYWRSFGVIAIIDVLGTIVLPISGIFLKDEPVAATTSVLALELSVGLAQRLDELAKAQNSSAAAVAVAALERELGSSSD